ncbi:hypothetical protein Catovirus_1_23 [Catovirus CTV1]|uniref:Uncharacterized protein n=1 Tax=Catovirus CTV1 TaxID=1977631 RepID=A0A1V0S8D9_9VIRU|nr:hypothetical protein Catovirus_1_23 [Catovirus CTV1]
MPILLLLNGNISNIGIMLDNSIPYILRAMLLSNIMSILLLLNGNISNIDIMFYNSNVYINKFLFFFYLIHYNLTHNMLCVNFYNRIIFFIF